MAEKKPTEMAPRKPTNGSNATSEPSKTVGSVVADWLIVYAQMYRQDLNPPLILAYQEGLSEVRRPELLHLALAKAMRSSQFMPNVKQILDAYDQECEKAPKPKQLAEGSEVWTAADQAEGLRLLNDVKLRIEGIKTLPTRPEENAALAARKRVLQKQKAQILKESKS